MRKTKFDDSQHEDEEKVEDTNQEWKQEDAVLHRAKQGDEVEKAKQKRTKSSEVAAVKSGRTIK